MPIKPQRLLPGDLVGIVAPASPPPEPRQVDLAINAVERLGFRVKLSRNVRKRMGFLAGSDRQRAADIMAMFTDRAVKAIFCLRGGYGSARLLSHLDYRIIKTHPKIFVGYSDITSLLCAFLSRANLVSFHGPVLSSELTDADTPEFTLNCLLRTISAAVPAGNICHDSKNDAIQVIHRGRAVGRLLGGNLSVLCASIGTRYQPSFRGKILFIEETGEAPYRVDRMMTHLLNAGVMQQIAGIAIGSVRNCLDPRAIQTTEFRQTVEEVFRERIRPLKVPALLGLPFGHDRFNATLPVGVLASLDSIRRELTIDEPAVV